MSQGKYRVSRTNQKLFFLAPLAVIMLFACATTTVVTQAPLPTITEQSRATVVTLAVRETQAVEPVASSEVGLPIVLVQATHTPTVTPTATEVPPPQPVRIAVIGDYGTSGQPEEDVANLVTSWQPDLVITTGDNNYPSGEQSTIDVNIGQYYQSYIYPYTGSYGPGAEQNRFFPSMGNHDWVTPNAQPYLDYFTLPGNERYYEFTWGAVHFYALDSDGHEPDGIGSSSNQANWLHERLNESGEPWKIVYMHHPPYSSGIHGSISWMRWPFQEWGATAVLAGHDHTYERIVRDGFPYFVNGLGGGPIYSFGILVGGSEVRYNGDHGAMLIVADEATITFQFINHQGQLIDEYTLHQN